MVKKLMGIWGAAALFAASAAAEENPLGKAIASLEPVLAPLSKIAVIRPEATGTTEDLSGLEEELLKAVRAKPERAVIGPDEVFATIGPEFADSPKGVAKVAKKLAVQAALFPRVFKVDDHYELNLLLVDAAQKTLLDQTFQLPTLPAGREPPPEAPPAGALEPPSGPPVLAEPPPAQAVEDPLATFERRALALAPRQRIIPGSAVVMGGGHMAVVVAEPPLIATDWMVVQGGKPISEPRLALLTKNQALDLQLKRRISGMKTTRNVGIAMTLGGFLAAGIASPFFKEGSQEGLTGAGIAVGVGLSVGAVGLFLWLIYGPEAAMAETPYPNHHLITREQAEDMIRRYNEDLQQELGLDPTPVSTRESPSGSELNFSIAPDPRGGGNFSLQMHF